MPNDRFLHHAASGALTVEGLRFDVTFDPARTFVAYALLRGFALHPVGGAR